MEKSEDLEETQTISPLDLNEENENKKKDSHHRQHHRGNRGPRRCWWLRVCVHECLQ